jgi:hypothetical protein
MRYYSYKIEHDFGLAPNPFWGYCTLAVCKGQIRASKKLQNGDWIIGTGSKELKKLHHLIFLMQVQDKIEMNDYWNDPKFQIKKPVLNGSLTQMYGDNVYHRDSETNEWIQEDCAHSLDNGVTHSDHLIADTSGKYVLISKKFYYFGDNCPKIPDEFLSVCCESRGYITDKIPLDIAEKFIDWVKNQYPIGIHGDPINWKRYKLNDFEIWPKDVDKFDY